MIKAYSKRKLQRTQSGRIALLRNLAESLVLSEKIVTTLPKAKELQSFFDKIITSAKIGGTTGFRRVNVHIKDKQVINKIFEILIPRYTDRNSGFTQLFKMSKPRLGDAASMALIKLVQ